MTKVYILKEYANSDCNHSSVLGVYANESKAYEEMERICSMKYNHGRKLLMDVTEMELIVDIRPYNRRGGVEDD